MSLVVASYISTVSIAEIQMQIGRKNADPKSTVDCEAVRISAENATNWSQ